MKLYQFSGNRLKCCGRVCSSLLGLSNSGKVSRRVRRSQELGSARGPEDFEELEELVGREVWEAERHTFGCDYSATRSFGDLCVQKVKNDI